ncbi:FG-GAP-like repeat-containing protein [Candidatus Peribacteria bacterium]|nr:MAG: FG-GAP-like repeat-containing protein [Candidatus Peribacteria bacterium]
MQSPFQTIGSLDALRSADVLTLTPLPVAISKQEKITWVHETLACFRYGVLTREDKGLVRRYLQHMTGYSRAQIARHIADALTQSLVTEVSPKTFSWKNYGILAALLLLVTLLSTSTLRSQASVLQMLTPEKAAVETGTGDMIASRTFVVSTMSTDTAGAIAYPLVAMTEEIAVVNGQRMRVTKVSDAATLLRHVAERRASRLARLLASHSAAGNPPARPVPDILPVYPAYPSSQLHGAAPDNTFTALPGLWSSIGLGTQGQILMIENGRPVWHDFPYLEQIRTLAPQGNEPTRRAGGQRSGGSPQSSTTTIINNTTTTTAAAPSGWTEGTGVVYLTDSTDSVGIGTDTPAATLEVVGSISGASLYVASSIEGAGLTSCDAVNQKLLWDSVTKQFTCGTDNAVGTGLSTAIADVRYVKKQGDTMTGALVIDIRNGTLASVGLNVINTLSGAQIHAEKNLTTSGTLVFEGAASGSSLYLGSSLRGAGLIDCDTSGTSKLLWDATNGRFACGTDTDTDTNTTYTAGQGLSLNGTVFTLNATLTGSLIRFQTLSGSTVYGKNLIASSGSIVLEGNLSGATINGFGLQSCNGASQKLLWNTVTGKFECGADVDTDTNTTYTAGKGLGLNGTSFSLNNTITGSLVRFDTISGSTVYGKNSVNSSGSITAEGAISGSTLFAGTSLRGAGLIDCSTAGTSKLLWNSVSGRFSCGTDQNTGTAYTAGQGLSVNGTVITLNATITGSLVRFDTISGSTVYGKNSVNSSGSITAEGAISGSTLFAGTSLRGAGLIDCDTSGTSKLLWDATTGRFSCGTDQSGGGAGSMSSGNVMTIGDARYVRTAGGTMTGALVVQNGNTHTPTDAALINVRGTISGTTLYANSALRSSGSITAEGAISGSTLFAGTSIRGGGLIDCDTSSTSKLLWDSTSGRFSCGTDTDTNTTYTAGQGLSLNGTVLTLNATLTGSLIRFQTLSGSTVYGKNLIASSGSIVLEGNLTGATINGFGLTSCSAVGQKLLWNTATGKFECGADTDTNTTYTAGKGLGLNGTSFSLNAAITGSLVRFDTISGSTVYGKNSVNSSGSITAEGAISGSTLFAGTSLRGAGLADCDVAGTNKLLWDSTSGRFSCGTDTDTTSYFSTGNVLTIGNAKYVSKQGDTMTGALVIDMQGGTLGSIGLKVLNTLSGAIIHAEKTLSSSGTIMARGNIWTKAGFSGATLEIGHGAFGSPSIKFGGTNDGIFHGGDNHLELVVGGNTAFQAFPNQVRIPRGTVSAPGMVWTDATTTGFFSSVGSAISASITGAEKFRIDTTGIKIFSAASGSILHAEKTLSTSGSLVFEGAASGSSLYLGTSLNGAGLVDCDTSGTSKLLWDATSGRFSCGTDTDTDTNTTYTAGQGLSLNGTVLTLNATLTGSLIRFQTLSGSTVYGKNLIASSGSIVLEGNLTGATINGFGLQACNNANQKLLWNTVTGKFECGADTDTNTTYTAGKGLGLNGTSFSLNATITGSLVRFDTISGSTVYGKNSVNSSGSITAEGAISGSTLYAGTSIRGAGLVDCTSVGTDKLLWNATTGRFSCGIDQTGGAGFGSGQVVVIGDARYVKRSGDTMTGSLIIRSTSGSSAVGLSVIGTMSGVGLNVSGTGAFPLIRTLPRSGTVLIGTGGIRGGSGMIMPQLFVPGKTPVLIGNTSTTAAIDHMALQGNTIISTAGTVLRSFDVSIPTGPKSLSTANVTSSNPASIVVQGKYAFIGVQTKIQSFDISNPSAMVPLHVFTPTSAVNALAIQGRYLFSLNTTSARFQTVDISNPANMVSGGTVATGTTPNAIAVAGRYAYVTNGGGGTLQIIDLKNPWSPVSIGTTSAGTTPNGVAIQERYAYVINTAGLQIFDVSNPASVLTLGSAAVGTQSAIAVSGRYAYVVGANGLITIDISDPRAPTVVSTVSAGLTTLNQIIVDGRYAYVSYTGGTRLYVYDLGGTYTQTAEIGSLEVGSLTIHGITQGMDANFQGSISTATSLFVAGHASFGTGGQVTIGTGGLIVRGPGFSGSTVYAATSLQGAGLTDCDVASSSKLLWDSTTGRFSCGTDTAGGGFSTGNVMTIGSANFVKKIGDTMTGTLIIDIKNGTLGSLGLRVINTLSGAIIHAEKELTSSGTLMVKQTGTTRGSGALTVVNTTRYGTGSYMAASGAILVLDSTAGGAGNSKSPHILFGYKGNFDTALWRSGAATLSTNGTFSGVTLYANSAIRSSGSIVAEGAISGSSLYAGTSISGAGLSDCDTAATSKLLWDSTTGRFSCGTDQSGGSFSTGNVMTIGSANFVKKIGDTMTGTLIIDIKNGTLGSLGLKVVNTFSGAIIHAEKELTSSGTLMVKQTGTTRGSGALTVVNTTRYGTGAYMAASGAILALDATSTASRHILFGYRGNFDTRLWRSSATVLSTNGTFSGASLYADNTIRGAGLSDCDNASTSKLLWDSTTGRFSCGTDGGGTGGNFVEIGGDTMTGSLVTPGLNLSGVTLSSINGFQKYLNITNAGLATQGITRLTQEGNITNIGSIQAGSALFTSAGAFPSAVTYAGTSNFYSVALGDIDGDGSVDMVTGTLNGQYSKFLNNGDGTFGSRSDFTTGGTIYGLQLSDLNGDGMLDIAAADGSDMVVQLNNGDGTFATKVSYAASYPVNIATADVNGDARPDVLVAENIDNTVSVYINNGNGTFAAKVDYAANVGHTFDVEAGDINGDGYMDILACGGNDNVVSTFLNRGNGTFAAKVDISTQSSINYMAVSDVNMDGAVDFVTISSTQTNASVHINNGDGTFATKVDYPTGTSGHDIRLTDVNGDGVPDIVLASPVVLLNKGNGTFNTATNYSTAGNAFTLDTADLNRDGKQDIVTIANADNTAHVLLNRSTPTLSVQAGTGGMVGIGTTTLKAKFTIRSTTSFGTGASIYASGAVLTLQASTQSGARTPNLLFGYRGAFDTRITRTSTGSLTFASNTGVLLTLNTERADATGNVFQIISDATTSFGGPDENKVFRIQANGATFADGAYTSNGADYAEWFYSGNEKLKSGEVVCIDITKNNTVKRCLNEADSNVMGIVSTNPAFIGNGITGADGIIPPGYALIGLIGQVPTKVIVSGTGSIRPGDALTPASTPGYARKAMPGESTVGVALEGIASGEGVINVLISRRNSSMTVDAVGQKVLDTIASMKIGDEVQLMVASSLENLNVDSQIQEEVQKQVSGIKSYDADILSLQTELDDLKNQLALIKSQTGSTTTVITTTGSALAADLTAATLVLEQTLATGGDARIGGDLHLDGTLMASSLFVPNGLSIDGGATITGTLAATTIHSTSGATIDGTLTVNGDIRISSGSLLFDSGATLSLSDLVVERSLIILGDITIDGLARFFGNVEVHGELRVSGRQAGTVTIPAHTTGATVLFSSGFTAVPVVTASPNDFVLSAWRIKPVTQTGFTIEFAATQDTDVVFSWHALISMGSGFTVQPNAVADTSMIFPMGSDNIPVSSDMYWNACIRSIAIFDADGKPHSCARYHEDYTWTQPDLHIDFLWNTAITPPLLHLPDGYTLEVTEDAESIRSAFNMGDPIEESSASSEPVIESPSSSASSVEEVIEEVDGGAEASSSSVSSETVTSETSASSATSENPTPTEELTIAPAATEPETPVVTEPTPTPEAEPQPEAPVVTE